MSADASRRLRAAEAYLERGWKLFTVSESKRPWQNCAQCPPGDHDGEACEHPSCHSFQAATADLAVLEGLFIAYPEAHLAVRTGTPSGIVVVDAEGTDRIGYGCTGVEYLETMDWWGDSLRSQSTSGGVHIFYKVESAIPSRNRVRPNIDIKGDGGYVVLPPAPGRTWLNWTSKNGCPDLPAEDLDAWLRNVKTMNTGRGVSSGRSHGQRAPLPDQTVPGGVRYAFTRDLVYFLRRSGMPQLEAWEVCRSWYAVYEQPPVTEYRLPWRQVEYELERVWARVEPEPTLDDALRTWMMKAGDQE